MPGGGWLLVAGVGRHYRAVSPRCQFPAAEGPFRRLFAAVVELRTWLEARLERVDLLTPRLPRVREIVVHRYAVLH